VDLFYSLIRYGEAGLGWIFSSSWLPPKDFQLLRWLFVPGYGYGFVFVLFALLEWLVPQERRLWNRRSLLSGTYILLAAKMSVYAVIVTPLFRNGWVHLGLPSFHLDRRLPWLSYVIASLLLVTFSEYWAHRLMHRLPLLWQIHKIHHSPVNLNWTSIYHNHVLEDLLSTPFHLVLVLLLGTDIVAPFGIFFRVVDVFGHSNVRFDARWLNWLSYVISTPHAHRVHHSADSKHYDRNFGNTFMLWDHVFGTFVYDPNPLRYGVTEPIPTSFLKQQVLPFAWIVKEAWARTKAVNRTKQEAMAPAD
jgi:sterol desaturase/sphingolipid hydroxylase (fatty acid hydroxylase superfamily)